jgi:hypothetical protein
LQDLNHHQMKSKTSNLLVPYKSDSTFIHKRPSSKDQHPQNRGIKTGWQHGRSQNIRFSWECDLPARRNRCRDWLIDWLHILFYVPLRLKNVSLISRGNHCRWRAAIFRPIFGAQGLWAERDPPAVTRELDFSGLIRRTAPFTCLLRQGEDEDLF